MYCDNNDEFSRRINPYKYHEIIVIKNAFDRGSLSNQVPNQTQLEHERCVREAVHGSQALKEPRKPFGRSDVHSRDREQYSQAL